MKSKKRRIGGDTERTTLGGTTSETTGTHTHARAQRDSSMVGGFGEAVGITAEVKEIVTAKKAECEGKTGKTFETFDPVSFVKQVVAGMNYKVKVKVGETDCIHVLVYCPLPHTGEGPKLVSVEEGKKVEDKIE